MKIAYLTAILKRYIFGQKVVFLKEGSMEPLAEVWGTLYAVFKY